jgi:NADPH:quinone reductase-like Zn-dependent oxidoreductase
MNDTTGATMCAVLLTGHGGPEMLVYRDDVPVPDAAGGELVVKVGACGINNTDIWSREGAYGHESDADAVTGWKREPMHFPRIQGADIVGRVHAVGADVDEARVGGRVIVDPTLYTDQGDGLIGCGIIGSERDGGFAEFVSVPADNAHGISSDWSDAELATFPCAYVTAERMLNRARVITGETVLVTGASGGVGSALVQLVAARGARAVAVVGADKAKALRELEPAAIVQREVDDLPAAVREILGDCPVDAVTDTVGGPGVGALLELLRPEGRYVTAGAIAGPIVQVDLRTVYLKHLELIGSTLGSRKEFAALLAYIRDGQLRPLLVASYRLQDLGRAQQDFGRKQHLGKLVIQVAGEEAGA